MGVFLGDWIGLDWTGLDGISICLIDYLLAYYLVFTCVDWSFEPGYLFVCLLDCLVVCLVSCISGDCIASMYVCGYC